MLQIQRVDYVYDTSEKVDAVSRSIGLFQEAAIFLDPIRTHSFLIS